MTLSSIVESVCPTLSSNQIGVDNSGAFPVPDSAWNIIDDYVINVRRGNNNGETYLFDVSDPSNPIYSGITIPTPYRVNHISFSEDNSYGIAVSNGGAGPTQWNMYIINTTSPINLNLAVISSFKTLPQASNSASWMDDRNERVYISSSGGRGVIVVDISDLQNPVELFSSPSSYSASYISCKYINESDSYPYCFVSDINDDEIKIYEMRSLDMLLIQRVGSLINNNPFEITISSEVDSLIINFRNGQFNEILHFSGIDSGPTAVLGPSYQILDGNRVPPRGASLKLFYNDVTDRHYLFTLTRNGWFSGLCLGSDLSSIELMSSVRVLVTTSTRTSFFHLSSVDNRWYFYHNDRTGADAFYVRSMEWCGSTIIDPGEQCDSNGLCCNNTDCTFLPADTLCSEATQLCEMNATCTGSSSSCPSNQPQPDDYVCRIINPIDKGLCEFDTVLCDGVIFSCPEHRYKQMNTPCGNEGLFPICKTRRECTGGSEFCPNSVFLPDGTLCFLDDLDCTIDTCQEGICKLIDNSSCSTNDIIPVTLPKDVENFNPVNLFGDDVGDEETHSTLTGLTIGLICGIVAIVFLIMLMIII